MKSSILIFVFLVLAVRGQIVLSTRNSCQCYQLSNESECVQFYPYCSWNIYVYGEQCQQNSCQNLSSQADCLLLPNCLWSGTQCQQFIVNYNNSITCSDLTATSNLSCQQQSRQCFGTSGSCISQDQLPSCLTYLTQQTCKFGYQGKCTWSGNQCYFYENCGQIPVSQCNAFSPYQQKTPKGQYCHVNGTGVCTQSRCSDLTTQTTCTYVQTVFNQDQFLLCSWNATNNTCSNAITTENLTQEDCLTSTLLNYHWIAYNAQTTYGTCFQCQFDLKLGSNQCLCDQLIAKLDCVNAKSCTWQSNQCVPTICTTINTQQICASSPACMWVFEKGCQTFTKCTDLQGKNQYQCLAQSTQCANSNGIYCTQLQNNLINYQFLCSEISYQSLCTNAVLGFAFCQWNSYNQTCLFSTSCYQMEIGQCGIYKHLCYWVDYGYCEPIYSCNDYQNENDCSFFYNLQNDMLFYCIWNSALRQCLNTDPSLLPYNTCYSNTLGQYRWSSHDNQVGTCIQCSSALLPSRKNQCECNQLIYQGDCAMGGESCIWNFELSQCVILDCTTLRTRGTCIANYNCHWIQRDSVMQCLPFKSCDNLPGSNSYQCMLYSFRCTSSDGQYCKELSYTNTSNKCSSITNYTNCYLTVARDGVCRWNEQAQQCYSLQDCNQIENANLCGINNYACYWNYQLEKCQSVSCEMVTTEQECTYFDKTIGTTPSIQICQWNQTCMNATSVDKFNSTDCFVNSAKTYRWSTNNGTDGNCESCSYSSIVVSIIAIAIGIII